MIVMRGLEPRLRKTILLKKVPGIDGQRAFVIDSEKKKDFYCIFYVLFKKV